MEVQEQGFFNIASWIMENVTALASIAYAAAFIVFLAYIYKRAGSMHFLRDRIWRLMGGKSEFLIPDLQKLKLEERELEHFRFEFGIPASTIEDIELFEKWISKNKISLKDAAAAKGYIDWADYRNLKIKEKSLPFLRTFFRYSGLAALFSAALFFLAATPNYLMASFDDSPFFYVSTKETRFSVFGGDVLDSSSCKEKDELVNFSQNNNFPLERLHSICDVYNSEEQLNSLKSRINEQKAAAFSLILLSIVVMVYFSLKSAKIFAAERIQRTLESNTELSSGAQRNS